MSMEGREMNFAITKEREVNFATTNFGRLLSQKREPGVEAAELEFAGAHGVNRQE